MPREEAASERASAGELSVARVRLGVVLFLALVYVLQADHSADDALLAGGLLAIMVAVQALIVVHEPLRTALSRLPGHLRIVGSSLVLTLLVFATGGIGSPFYLVYFVNVVGAAYRFGTREAWLAALVNSAGYSVLLAVPGELARWPEVAVRLGFLLLVASHAALLTREVMEQANARLEMRERMQEARTAEARFRGLLEAAPDAMVIADRDGRIVLVNTETERVFGYSREELLGKPIDLLVPNASTAPPPAPPPAPLRSIAEGEALGRRRDGTTLPVEVRVSPVETEGGRLYTSTIRDLTERKRAEEDRLTSLERLQELERLRELDQFKTTFINTAAHELGTPLTPIKLQLHLLKTSKQGELSEQQKRSLVILERNVDRLHELVKDVLDVARLQASRLGIRREPVDLNRLVLEATESFQESARQAGVQLEARLTPDLVVEADPNRLTQVLFNLLANALKFTPRGGRITIESLRATHEDAIVRVSDTGIGLRVEDTRRLFQPFSQVHDRMQKTRSGSGLGLYISKGIVELHGGRIWVESRGSDQGSTFSFTIPFRAPALAPQATTAAPDAAPVEDDVAVQDADAVARRARELI